MLTGAHKRFFEARDSCDRDPGRPHDGCGTVLPRDSDCVWRVELGVVVGDAGENTLNVNLNELFIGVPGEY